MNLNNFEISYVFLADFFVDPLLSMAFYSRFGLKRAITTASMRLIKR